MKNESGPVAVVAAYGYLLVSAVRTPDEEVIVFRSPVIRWEDEDMAPVRQAVEGLAVIERDTVSDPGFMFGRRETTRYSVSA